VDATLQQSLDLFSEGFSQRISIALEHAGRWRTAREIAHCLGLPDTESNRRKIRKCAESLVDEIISGQQGYIHITHATAEEVEHFCSWMDSQADKMHHRATLTRLKKFPSPATETTT
jgi:hypothetical protein